MKKFKTGLFAITVIVGISLCAFTTAQPPITPGWYGQTSDGTSYTSDHLIPSEDLDMVCPDISTAHTCAVFLKSDGTLDPSQNPNIRKSLHNFQ